jgi:hypothetical protein
VSAFACAMHGVWGSGAAVSGARGGSCPMVTACTYGAELQLHRHPRSVMPSPGYNPLICHILMRDSMLWGLLPLADGAAQL